MLLLRVQYLQGPLGETPRKKPLKRLPFSFHGYNVPHVPGSDWGLTDLLLLDMKSVSRENLSRSWPGLLQVYPCGAFGAQGSSAASRV